MLLLIASCVLPCIPFLDVAGTSMPYQDPTPGMLTKQTAETAAAEHRLAVAAAIGVALALGGVTALIYAYRSRKPANET